MTKHYYTARNIGPGWCGKVYHYDAAGEKEIVDYLGSLRDEDEALDDAAEWAEENGVEVELE